MAARSSADRAFDRRTLSYQVIRRNVSVTPFNAGKLCVAVTKAFLAVEGGRGPRPVACTRSQRADTSR